MRNISSHYFVLFLITLISPLGFSDYCKVSLKRGSRTLASAKKEHSNCNTYCTSFARSKKSLLRRGDRKICRIFKQNKVTNTGIPASILAPSQPTSKAKLCAAVVGKNYTKPVLKFRANTEAECRTKMQNGISGNGVKSPGKKAGLAHVLAGKHRNKNIGIQYWDANSKFKGYTSTSIYDMSYAFSLGCQITSTSNKVKLQAHSKISAIDGGVALHVKLLEAIRSERACRTKCLQLSRLLSSDKYKPKIQNILGKNGLGCYWKGHNFPIRKGKVFYSEKKFIDLSR